MHANRAYRKLGSGTYTALLTFLLPMLHVSSGGQEVLQGTSLTRRTINQLMHLKASTLYCDNDLIIGDKGGALLCANVELMASPTPS
jgi:hypothetical protein